MHSHLQLWISKPSLIPFEWKTGRRFSILKHFLIKWKWPALRPFFLKIPLDVNAMKLSASCQALFSLGLFKSFCASDDIELATFFSNSLRGWCLSFFHTKLFLSNGPILLAKRGGFINSRKVAKQRLYRISLGVFYLIGIEN